jgi:putative SOS response-associated peptidase YedK
VCGRYELNATPLQIAARFGVLDVPAFAPNGDLRPTNQAPVIRLDRERARQCELMRWGLIPSWAGDIKIANRCFNARAETVATLPSFRTAYQRRRCIVPASAFFEWPLSAGRKHKMRIARHDGDLLAMAGLWEYWRDRNRPEEEGIVSYTIITTTPNADVAPYHNRMPVMLGIGQFDAWLDPSQGDARALLQPPAEGMLLAIEVA